MGDVRGRERGLRLFDNEGNRPWRADDGWGCGVDARLVDWEPVVGVEARRVGVDDVEREGNPEVAVG